MKATEILLSSAVVLQVWFLNSQHHNEFMPALELHQKHWVGARKLLRGSPYGHIELYLLETDTEPSTLQPKRRGTCHTTFEFLRPVGVRNQTGARLIPRAVMYVLRKMPACLKQTIEKQQVDCSSVAEGSAGPRFPPQHCKIKTWEKVGLEMGKVLEDQDCKWNCLVTQESSWAKSQKFSCQNTTLSSLLTSLCRP